ncbi:hypothetical protein E2P81_ATG09197 [Venturia nashicola]|nr:hypothetical protein E2P81_ATG09197 [Venturia nashicola]
MLFSHPDTIGSTNRETETNALKLENIELFGFSYVSVFVRVSDFIQATSLNSISIKIRGREDRKGSRLATDDRLGISCYIFRRIVIRHGPSFWAQKQSYGWRKGVLESMIL